MNKKSQVFIPLLTIAAMGALIFFLIHFSDTMDFKEDAPLAAYSSSIHEAQIESEKAFAYLDESALMAFDHTVLQLGKQGGFAKQSPCGIYVYELWNSPTSNLANCFPSHDDEFVLAFPALHQQLLAEYPTIDFSSSYQYTLSHNRTHYTLEGVASDRLPFPIVFGYGATDRNTCNSAVEPINTLPGVNCQASDCRLEHSAAEQLKKTVENLASRGYTLEITSAYRSFEYQQDLYNACVGKTCEGDVAVPSCDATHVQGRAIDIKIYKNGAILQTGPLGKGYSYEHYHFTPAQVREQLLVESLMCENGWVRYGYADNRREQKGEWWHFEFGTERQQKATVRGVCALI